MAIPGVRWPTPEPPRSAARPCRSCRFEASEPIPFPGANLIFSRRCGPFAGDSVGPLRAIPATATPRFERSTIGSAAASSERNRPGSRFLPHFVTFQGFSRRKISPRVATRLPSSARPALGHGGKRRVRPSRPRRSRIVPCARRCRCSSPRFECCRRSSAGSRGAKGETGRFQTLTLIRFSRKKIRQKIEPPEIDRAASRPCRKTLGKDRAPSRLALLIGPGDTQAARGAR